MTLNEFTETPEYVAASLLAQKAFETGVRADADAAAVAYRLLPGRI
jgi:hypothetical protein